MDISHINRALIQHNPDDPSTWVTQLIKVGDRVGFDDAWEVLVVKPRCVVICDVEYSGTFYMYYHDYQGWKNIPSFDVKRKKQ